MLRSNRWNFTKASGPVWIVFQNNCNPIIPTWRRTAFNWRLESESSFVTLTARQSNKPQSQSCKSNRDAFCWWEWRFHIVLTAGSRFPRSERHHVTKVVRFEEIIQVSSIRQGRIKRKGDAIVERREKSKRERAGKIEKKSVATSECGECRKKKKKSSSIDGSAHASWKPIWGNYVFCSARAGSPTKWQACRALPTWSFPIIIVT